MSHEILRLPADPAEALAVLRATSLHVPVLVFKKSPICHTSRETEAELSEWLSKRPADLPLMLAEVDVIAERMLARGLASLLAIRHESPQALLFKHGELAWHGSHGQLNVARFQAEVDGQRA